MAKRVITTFLNNDRDMFMLLNSRAESEGNSQLRRTAKKALKRVIEEQLSDRQKQYLVLYYFEDRDMPTIAKMFGVNVSTVSRTINRARQNIFKYMKYYFL
jgi:RNA polymerase sigma factor (sigma-70 family)